MQVAPYTRAPNPLIQVPVLPYPTIEGALYDPQGTWSLIENRYRSLPESYVRCMIHPRLIKIKAILT